MKVLWLCNVRFSQAPISSTGTWLQPLAEMINGIEDIEVVNLTFGSVIEVTAEKPLGITQYVLPNVDRLNIQKTGTLIANIINKEQPSLVHAWGIENVWGEIISKGYIKVPAFIDMQGMRSINNDYYGGLTFWEKLTCNLAPMSIYEPSSSLFMSYRKFKKEGAKENRILKSINRISVQSQWVEDHVRLINPNAKIYHTRIILREPFYNCGKWKWKGVTDSPVIFSMSSSSTPYKGLHVLIRAIAVLKTVYPNILLKVAGSFMGKRGSLFSSGYTRFLLKLIKGLDIESNVQFLGPLTSEQIIEELQSANACVIPSFIETYCVALAEAMMVGTPCVVSFAGAMPEYATNNQDALFYSSRDYVSCASRIHDLLSNRTLCEIISKNGIKRKEKDCDKNSLQSIQLKIYNSIIDDSNLK